MPTCGHGAPKEQRSADPPSLQVTSYEQTAFGHISGVSKHWSKGGLASPSPPNKPVDASCTEGYKQYPPALRLKVATHFITMRTFISTVAAAILLPLAWSRAVPTEFCTGGTPRTVTSYIGQDHNVLVEQTFCDGDVAEAPAKRAVELERRQSTNVCGTPCESACIKSVFDDAKKIIKRRQYILLHPIRRWS
jgi:hypothetical protein